MPKPLEPDDIDDGVQAIEVFGKQRVPNPAELYLHRLRSPASRRVQLGALRTMCAMLGGKDPLTFPWWDLRYEHTAALLAAMQESGAAPATVSRHLAALRRVLKECFRLGKLTGDEYMRASDVTVATPSRQLRGRMLEQEEIDALFLACEKDKTPYGVRDAALLAVLRFSGIRRHEVVKIRLADYEKKTGRFTVTIKRGKELAGRLGSAGRAFINRWLEYRPAGGEHLITHAESPKPLSDEAVFKILRKRAEEAGLDPKSFSAHDFRRTFISELLDKDVDVVTVMKMVGHDNPKTTARYDRRGEKRIAEAAEKIGTQ